MDQDKAKLRELLLEKYPALQANKPLHGFVPHRLINEAKEMGFSDKIVLPVVMALVRDHDRLNAMLNPLEEYVYNLEGQPCEFIQESNRQYAELHLENQRKQKLAWLKKKREKQSSQEPEAEPTQ
jgi:hypothetical protein